MKENERTYTDEYIIVHETKDFEHRLCQSRPEGTAGRSLDVIQLGHFTTSGALIIFCFESKTTSYEARLGAYAT